MESVSLHCTKCHKPFRADQAVFRCDACNEPLEAEEISKGRIREGNMLNQTIWERYGDFFPFLESGFKISLGEGFTPLAESRALAESLGMQGIYFKNESQNPTWSFKDRGTSAGIMHAKGLGYKRIGTVSTGNMATSVAAYGTASGMETFVLVSKGISQEKINPIAIYNPHLIKVDGDYGELYFESLRIGKENDIYFVNSDAPMRVEGSKTIAYEICEQLGFDMPDYVIVPTSAGGNIRGIEKGFREFRACGLIDRAPKIICAQALGCSPIYAAYKNGSEEISRAEDPHTIAHAIENPYPPSGNRVLKLLRQNGGISAAVSDEEILKAQALMAGEGIFGQPASAVPLAVVIKLKAEGILKGNEKIVCIVTGSGLKYTAALEMHELKSSECKLKELGNFIKNL
ncbi:threonine synthase [Lutispora saccharofermentans]|uniref:Threonine synthase n=1 Tax=Lutispora saccharofermentans TaxID=3024236 RepID=A0ABT1NHR3_9FIRM|nr:threonine synthase [Lutispora saccharofermentans]MCQ1530777.1 threonine synthase [Lutispora saccharofermentans]